MPVVVPVGNKNNLKVSLLEICKAQKGSILFIWLLYGFLLFFIKPCTN